MGNLGGEVTDPVLAEPFQTEFKSFAKARVVRDKYTGRSKCFGFLSFLSADDCISALKKYNGKVIGSRPIQLSRSRCKDRSIQGTRLHGKFARGKKRKHGGTGVRRHEKSRKGPWG